MSSHSGTQTDRATLSRTYNHNGKGQKSSGRNLQCLLKLWIYYTFCLLHITGQVQSQWRWPSFYRRRSNLRGNQSWLTPWFWAPGKQSLGTIPLWPLWGLALWLMCGKYSASVWVMNEHFSQQNCKATYCCMRKCQAVWIFHSSSISSKLLLPEEAILSWFQNFPEVLCFLSHDLWVCTYQPKWGKQCGRHGKNGAKSILIALG